MSAAPLSLRLWDVAYGVHEREKAWIDRLPELLAVRAPGWPLAETVAVDVGASVGTYTRSFTRWCHAVHAIEPQSGLAAALEGTVPENVTIHACAAGAAAGASHITDGAATGSRRPLARLGDPARAPWSEPCLVARLDALLPRNPAALVIKIDTEGSEFDVIEGMGELLSVANLILMVEIERRHNPDFQKVFAFLGAAGLAAHRVSRRRLITATPADVLRAARGPTGRLGALWPWGNNYLFLRPALAARLLGATPREE